VVAGGWGGGRWVQSLVCLWYFCYVGLGGVGVLVVVRLLVRELSMGIGEGLVKVVGILE